MSQVFDILQGHMNELFGNNNDLSETRLNICRECPIFRQSSSFGPMCDSTKYIHKDGIQWSHVRLADYVRGCGCRLGAKTRNPGNHCVVNKW